MADLVSAAWPLFIWARAESERVPEQTLCCRGHRVLTATLLCAALGLPRARAHSSSRLGRPDGRGEAAGDSRFHPLVWMTCTRLRREAEQAFDDEVLARGVERSAYAADLISLARQFRRPGSTWASATPMAHPSTLEGRIAAMLNPRLDRQRRSAELSGTVYDVSVAVLPGVQVALVDENQGTWTATTNVRGKFEVASRPTGQVCAGGPHEWLPFAPPGL